MKNGSTVRAEDRRAQIVAKAADLFDQKGYHGATMEDIGDAIGLAKPTLYHYFPSKDHILYAIHDDFIDLLISRQERRLAVDMPADQMLRELMGDILELMETHRGHVRVFFEHHRELTGEPRELIAEKRGRYEQMVRDVFIKGAASGSLRDVDPELATLALAGMCNWTYQWYQPQGRLASRDIAYVFWDYLINGLATRDGNSGASA